MLTEAEAIQKLAVLVDAQVEPCLSDDELQDCLAQHKRASYWQPGYIYQAGERVVSAVTHTLYTAGNGGLSGSDSPFTSDREHYYRIADADVLWHAVGSAPREIYDVQAAANACWIRKAAKAASLINVQDKDVKIDYASLQKQCLLMAAQFRSVFVL